VEGGRCPRGVAPFVAGVAIGNSHATERRIRYVVDRLSIRWRECSAMAGKALVCNDGLRVVPLGRLPGRGVVAAYAIDCSWNMRTQLSCSGTSVMATGAVCCRRKQTVVRLGTSPTGGGLVAGFAHGLACMNGSGRPTGQPVAGIQVTTCALA